MVFPIYSSRSLPVSVGICMLLIPRKHSDAVNMNDLPLPLLGEAHCFCWTDVLRLELPKVIQRDSGKPKYFSTLSSASTRKLFSLHQRGQTERLDLENYSSQTTRPSIRFSTADLPFGPVEPDSWTSRPTFLQQQKSQYYILGQTCVLLIYFSHTKSSPEQRPLKL